MVTIPYVSQQELDRKKITILTDKLGFYYFILRVTNRFHPKDIVMLSKDLNHKKRVNIDMKSLKHYSYVKIQKLILDN
jgi:hypothetical protein